MIKSLILVLLLTIVGCKPISAEVVPVTPPPTPPSTEKPEKPTEPGTPENPPQSNSMKITINDTAFSATLNGSPAAVAFAKMLPIDVTMGDLNANEKYYYLPSNLPTAPSSGRINSGDLKVFGSNCLVLFYESFSSSYSYTSLGRIDNVTGIKQAMGSGSVRVKFEIQ